MTCDVKLITIFIIGLHLKPEIEIDVQRFVVTNVFCHKMSLV